MIRIGTARFIQQSRVQLPGCGLVEYGATWFHGIEGNPLYEHAVRFGLVDRKEAEGQRKHCAYCALHCMANVKTVLYPHNMFEFALHGIWQPGALPPDMWDVT